MNVIPGKLLPAEGKGGGGEVIDPNVPGMTAQDEGFSPDTGSEDQDAFVFEEFDVFGQPAGEDFGDVPANVVVDFHPGAHFVHDFFLHPWVGEIHQSKGFLPDGEGLKEGRGHTGTGGEWMLWLGHARVGRENERMGKDDFSGDILPDLKMED